MAWARARKFTAVNVTEKYEEKADLSGEFASLEIKYGVAVIMASDIAEI